MQDWHAMGASPPTPDPNSLSCADDPRFEPSGEDFLSPGLCEMALMRRVLPSATDFTEWASAFMPSLLRVSPMPPAMAAPVAQLSAAAAADGRDANADATTSILQIPAVSDRTDARLCHLDGLLLSKAWALRACAEDLERGGAPPTATAAMRESAEAHYEAAAWATEEYVGSHWLHSFALLALDGS